MRGLNLKKTEAGTRPERLSSTNMGASGAWSQPEEDGGGDEAGALILNYNMGVQVRSLNLKESEAGTRPERLSSTNMGFEAHELKLKKTKAGTRPEGLSSTNRGSQGRGLKLHGLQPEQRVQAQCRERCVPTTEAAAQTDQARGDPCSVQPDPAMSSERSSERYLVGDDVELPGDHVQSSDVNLLRRALLEAREFLLSGYTEVGMRASQLPGPRVRDERFMMASCRKNTKRRCSSKAPSGLQAVIFLRVEWKKVWERKITASPRHSLTEREKRIRSQARPKIPIITGIT